MRRDGGAVRARLRGEGVGGPLLSAEARHLVPLLLDGGGGRPVLGGGLAVGASSAAFVPGRLQRALGEGARGGLGFELVLQLGRALLERVALALKDAVQFGDLGFEALDALLGALESRLPLIERFGEIGRTLRGGGSRGLDLGVRPAQGGQILLEVGEGRVLGFRRERVLEGALLVLADRSVSVAQRRARFRQELLGAVAACGDRVELLAQGRLGQAQRFGRVELRGLELPRRRSRPWVGQASRRGRLCARLTAARQDLPERAGVDEPLGLPAGPVQGKQR